MKRGAIRTAPEFEQRTGSLSASTPDNLLITFDVEQPPLGSFRADELSLDVFEGFFEGQVAVGVIALRYRNDAVLHIGQGADDLRNLAAHCLRAADTIDGGQGKQ